jgi:hypothetical protein
MNTEHTRQKTGDDLDTKFITVQRQKFCYEYNAKQMRRQV